MTERTGNRFMGATQKVLEYLRTQYNLTVTYADIEKATGLPRTTISNSIGYLIEKDMGVSRPMYGTALLNSGHKPETPKKKTDFELFENVGNVGDTRLVLRDEKGELWVAQPIRQFLTK